MKFCFISQCPKMSKGSYRIWVNDLNFYLNQLGHISCINPKNVDDYDILIIGKSAFRQVQIYRSKYPQKKILAINPPCSKENSHQYYNGCIVGSPEEKDSLLKFYKKILIIPLIEKLYKNEKPKKHIEKNEIVIGYHGHPSHLNHMKTGCKSALEKIAKERSIKLKIFIDEQTVMRWGWIRKSMPNIHIEFIPWNIKTIAKEILLVDIGIVPNISQFNNCIAKENTTLGEFGTDYIIRFKNKTNAGRCFVFWELGIPVIADMTPQVMHMLGDPNNGYPVCSKEGWYYAFKELLSFKRRQFISENALKEYKIKYNPIFWIKQFIDTI